MSEVETPPSYEDKTEETQESSGSGSTRVGGCNIDHTYLRSIEGILRVITIPISVLYVILTLVGYSIAGVWVGFFFGIGWIAYAVITIVIEVFITGVYVHRLIDGIVCIIWAVCWGIVTILAIAFGATSASAAVGVSAIFSFANAILVAVNGVFALRTWRTYEDGRRGSVAIFVI